MARLIYSMITSLDGYVKDPAGDFGWAEPGAELFRFINDLERPVGTHLYGRRMYETMAGWETDPSLAEGSPEMRDFASIWRAADKVVHSTTLEEVATSRTRLERGFDADAIRRLKAGAERDISISGPGLAAHALRAGVVDELQPFVTPVVVGGGTPFLPGGVRLRLDLADQRSFDGGVVYLRYIVRP